MANTELFNPTELFQANKNLSQQSSVWLDVTQSVAIEGPLGCGKTRALADRVYTLLTDKTIPTESILVISSNYSRKEALLENIQERLAPDETWASAQLPFTTFSALVRNTLLMFWPAVEQTIETHFANQGDSVIFPNLSGFGASEFVMHWLVQQQCQRDPGFAEAFAERPATVVSQLIRRVRLRAENHLTRHEMGKRSQVLGEPWVGEVDGLSREFDRLSSVLRVLDSSRQMDAFFHLLDTNDAVADWFRSRVRYLVVDDVDETTPAQQRFMSWLLPSLTSVTLAADPRGGSRRGYLNAYPAGWEPLLANIPGIRRFTIQRDDPVYCAAEQLTHNWLVLDERDRQPLQPGEALSWRVFSVHRSAMIQAVLDDVVSLLTRADGKKPGDLVIVMPKVDLLGQWMIHQTCQRWGIPIQWLTGTHRPNQNPSVKALLAGLLLLNHVQWQLPFSLPELRYFLRDVLGLHVWDPKGTELLIQACQRDDKPYEDSTTWVVTRLKRHTDRCRGQARAVLESLFEWLDQQDTDGTEALDTDAESTSPRLINEPVETQIYAVFDHLIKPTLARMQLRSPEQLAMGAVQEVIGSLSLIDIAQALNPEWERRWAERSWYLQVKHGRIADSPEKPASADPNAIVVGTPQKIIDLDIKRPVQLWLDVASREWSRSDQAPLYNAWVHSANWTGDPEEITEGFQLHLIRQRAAHVMRQLVLSATEHIYLYASHLDETGDMHCGQLPRCLAMTIPLDATVLKSGAGTITLRSDQQAILNYQQGEMAVTAVPGAGKTFVNVALILHLIAQGWEPESILVLTYMESAAQTMLNRLKAKLGNQTPSLPVVSTIHSLALRLLTEDDNARLVGLNPEQLAVVEEGQRQSVVDGLLAQRFAHNEQPFNAATFIKAVETLKAHRLTPAKCRALLNNRTSKAGLTKVTAFVEFYEAYQEHLQHHGWMDFTDLIVYAVQLLEEHPVIREQYQKRFRLVMEDEAQDSSLLLQQLLNYLQGPGGNLIRTGDTNQSITTTFSSADTSVFREFIASCQQQNTCVSMTYSGRCAPEVMTLANHLVAWSTTDDTLKQAFQPVDMHPIEGYNPQLLQPIQAVPHPTSEDELAWLIEDIQRTMSRHPSASLAVLVRFNADCDRLLQRLTEAGVPAVSPTEGHSGVVVLKLIVDMCRLLLDPMDKPTLVSLFQQFMQQEMIPDDKSWLETLSETSLLDAPMLPNCPEPLLQLYYHWQALQPYAHGNDMAGLLIRLTDTVLMWPNQKNLGYLCALKAQQWVQSHRDASEDAMGAVDSSPLEVVIRELSQCVRQKKLPFKHAAEWVAMPLVKPIQGTAETAPKPESPAVSQRFVTVMTLHKSKGMEFDCVWIPMMTENRFPSQTSSVMWQDSDKLNLQLDLLRLNLPFEDTQAVMHAKKIAKIEEEARLIYVGITRAQRSLALSSHELWNSDLGSKRKKPETKHHARLFQVLHNHLYPQPVANVAPEGGS